MRRGRAETCCFVYMFAIWPLITVNQILSKRTIVQQNVQRGCFRYVIALLVEAQAGTDVSPVPHVHAGNGRSVLPRGPGPVTAAKQPGR